jgi:hypothetical protein
LLAAFFGKLKLFVIDNENQRKGTKLKMIKITQDGLLQEPETTRPTPLGRLITTFDVIVSDSIPESGQGEPVIYDKFRYQIEKVDLDTIIPNEYVRLHCSQIKEVDKRFKPTGTLF